MSNRCLLAAAVTLTACSTPDSAPRIQSSSHALVPGIDLYVASLTTPPTSGSGQLTAQIRVCNNGDQFAPSSMIELYQSSDDVILPGPPPTGDFMIGQEWVDSLAPGQCRNVSTQTWGAPFGGEQHVGVVVDPQQVIGEADEGNNTFVSGVIGFGWGPDSIVTAIEAPHAVQGSFAARVTVCNQGTSWSGGVQVELYATDDLVLDPMADFMVGSDWINGLAEGQCETRTFMAWAPPLQGAAHLAARVDGGQLSMELIESNNDFVGELMGFGWGPELVVTAISTPPSAAGAFDAMVRVCNLGTSNIGGTDFHLYASPDEFLDLGPPPSGDFLITSGWVSWLPAGQCQDATVPAWAPGFFSEGYLIAAVDPNDQVPELIESNNTFTGGVMGFGWGPDLVVTEIVSPPSIGGSFSAQVTVCNQGTQDSPGAGLDLYATPDETLEAGPMPGGDWLVASAWSSWIPAGQCLDVEVFGWQPPLQGEGRLAAVVDGFGQLIELVESNNTRIGDVIGFGQGPDLVVTSIGSPPNVDGGFTAQITVCNRGNQPSPGSNVDIHVSQDTILTPGPPNDPIVGGVWSNSLQPGQCETLPAMLWVPQIFSPAHLAAIVDPMEQLMELVESNNTLVAPPIGVGAGPDLVATEILAPHAVNSAFTAQVRVCNQGTSQAGGANLSLFSSPDAALEVGTPPPFGDFPVGDAWVDPLLPGQCRWVSVNGWPTPLFGEGHLIAAVDHFQQLVELQEANNHFVGPVIGFGQGPDLAVTAIATPYSAQGPFTAEVTVCNRGTDFSPGAMVDLYATTDDEVEIGVPPPFGDFIIGSSGVNGLAPEQCEVLIVNAWGAPLMGEARVAAVVDPFEQVSELIESNNTFIGGVMGFGSGPDLVAIALSAPPSASGSFTAQATVCNRGTTPSPGAPIDLYASSDTTLSVGPPPSGDWMVGSGFVNSLDAGECTFVNIPAWAPPLQGAGHLAAVVDAPQQVAELVESNNTFFGSVMGFGPGFDLVITALSAPPSIDGTFVASVTACNQGNVSVSGVEIGLFGSADTVWEPMPSGDFPINFAPTGNLLPGQCEVLAIQGWPPPLPGPVHLIAVADPFQQYLELIETNNTRASGLIGVGSGPDLVITTITAPTVVDGNFTAQVTTCNQGTQPSPSTHLELYASRDAVFTGGPAPGGDVLVGSAMANPLAPGACQTVPVMAWSPPLQGSGHLVAVADSPSQVMELIESNNVRVGGVMGFGSGVELVVQSLNADPYVRPGMSVSFTYSVCNQGNVASPSTTLGVGVSLFADGQIQPPMVQLPIPPLSPGQCSNGTSSAPNDLAEGPAFVVAMADLGNVQAELVEQNNRSADPVLVAFNYCGNGELNMGEACDDGNFASGDGCSASCAVEYHHVWAENAYGSQAVNVGYSYAMGYHFTPLTNGYITGLGGLFSGTKIVRLFNRNTGALLAQTTVTSANQFAMVNIPAIAVTANQRYTVAVYLAGSGGSYRSGVSFPRTFGDVRIDATTYVATSGSASTRPTNAVTSMMYGQADVRFSRYP